MNAHSAPRDGATRRRALVIEADADLARDIVGLLARGGVECDSEARIEDLGPAAGPYALAIVGVGECRDRTEHTIRAIRARNKGVRIAVLLDLYADLAGGDPGWHGADKVIPRPTCLSDYFHFREAVLELGGGCSPDGADQGGMS